MTIKNNPNIGHNKKSLLKNPVEHIDITSFDARPIIDGMSKMSFSSRDTASAAKIYNEMIADDNCSIFLTLAAVLLITVLPILTWPSPATTTSLFFLIRTIVVIGNTWRLIRILQVFD